MKVVLVALYDVHSFAIRAFHTLLEREGHKVKSIYFKNNYTNQKPTLNERDTLISTIKGENPDLVAFSLRSPFFPLFKDIVSFLVDIKVIVGGHHATVCPEEIIPLVNYVCVGEGENTLLELCKRIQYKTSPLGIENLWVRNNGVVVKGKKDVLPYFIEALPNYSDNNIYIDSDPGFDTTERMAVISTRGCFFNCSFCYNQTLRDLKLSRVRRKNISGVMKEISFLQGRFKNLKEIVFSYIFFTWGIDWIEKFCKEFKKTDLKFRCFGHISLVDEDSLQMIKDAGCHMITFGIQSGSEYIRKKILNRPETDMDIIKASKVIASIGFDSVRYDIIEGVPYEDGITKFATENLLLNLARPFTVRRFNMMHFPKTKLTEELLNNGMIDKKDIQGNCTTSYREWMKEEHYG